MKRPYFLFPFIFAILMASALMPHTASAALVGYWKFDETGAGSAAVDSSGSGYNGTPVGSGGSQTSGPQGTTTVKAPTDFANTGSYYFDGTDDYLDLPDGFADFTAGMTITLWARPTNSNCWARFFDFGNGASSDNIIIARNGCSSNFYYEAYRGSSTRKTSVTNPAIALNEWHYYTVTMAPTSPGATDSTVQVYVDGVLATMDTTSGYVPKNLIRVNNYIGKSNWNDPYYQGYIDDLRIYNTALTPTEVQQLADGNAGPGVDTTPPVITNVASSVTSTGATITWTTDEAASTKVIYSSNTQYASSTSETDTSPGVTSHSKSLTGLLSCTLYNFKVVSADSSGNYAIATSTTLMTTGCSGGATPTSATSTAISVSAAATSTITDSGRSFSIATPAHFTAASSSIVIQIKGLPSDTVLGSIGKPAGLSSAARIVFDVTALVDNITTLDSFDIPVTIAYTYTDADISGLDENTLKMYHYHGGAWLALDNCSVNASANTITCTAPSFSTFAIFGSAPAVSSSGGGSTLPWCSGPAAPGWIASLRDGGCGTKSTTATTSVFAHVCPTYRFTRTLRFGMTGEDVKALQKLMNCLGFALASSGPGSPGKETNLFVERTFAAVVKFQETYKKEVLDPINATKGTGIFADYSQKKAANLTK